jgi:hypothetical protein
MSDRKTPEPRSPFTEALKANPKDLARQAESVLGSGEDHEAVQANKELNSKGKAGDRDGAAGPQDTQILKGSTGTPLV